MTRKRQQLGARANMGSGSISFVLTTLRMTEFDRMTNLPISLNSQVQDL